MHINLRANIALGLVFAFLANTLGPCPVYAQDFVLPAPGQMVALSPAFSPAVLKGIKLDPKNPFRFHFFVDRGDSSLSQEELKEESAKLIKYFLASLTIPEKDLWVNLSPYEKDRIVPQEFGQTEMGRDLLAEDYLLKQITASLIYPESQLGKEFWKKVYAQAQAKYGTTNIPINTFNKVWIVPEKAVVYENEGMAFVLENHLKVMLEQDYLSLQKHTGFSTVIPAKAGIHNNNDINALGSQIVREIVIPALTKEVNEGKNFSQLRQVFYSLILATWYKMKIKDSILNKVYSNRNKIGGVNVSVEDKDKIYQEYLKAFKKGVYNYIKEEPDLVTGQTMPRKYFSGGFLMLVPLEVHNKAQLSRMDMALISKSLVTEVDGVAQVNTDGAMKADRKLIASFLENSSNRYNVYDFITTRLRNNDVNVVGLGENHASLKQMKLKRKIIRELIRQGLITHYAIEMRGKHKDSLISFLDFWISKYPLENPKEVLKKMKQSSQDSLKIASNILENYYSTAWPDDARSEVLLLLREVYEAHIPIVCIDAYDERDPNIDREMAQNIASIIKDNRKAKVVVSVGGAHASYSGFGKFLRANKGIKYYSIELYSTPNHRIPVFLNPEVGIPMFDKAIEEVGDATFMFADLSNTPLRNVIWNRKKLGRESDSIVLIGNDNASLSERIEPTNAAMTGATGASKKAPQRYGAKNILTAAVPDSEMARDIQKRLIKSRLENYIFDIGKRVKHGNLWVMYTVKGHPELPVIKIPIMPRPWLIDAVEFASYSLGGLVAPFVAIENVKFNFRTNDGRIVPVTYKYAVVQENLKQVRKTYKDFDSQISAIQDEIKKRRVLYRDSFSRKNSGLRRSDGSLLLVDFGLMQKRGLKHLVPLPDVPEFDFAMNAQKEGNLGKNKADGAMNALVKSKVDQLIIHREGGQNFRMDSNFRRPKDVNNPMAEIMAKQDALEVLDFIKNHISIGSGVTYTQFTMLVIYVDTRELKRRLVPVYNRLWFEIVNLFKLQRWFFISLPPKREQMAAFLRLGFTGPRVDQNKKYRRMVTIINQTADALKNKITGNVAMIVPSNGKTFDDILEAWRKKGYGPGVDLRKRQSKSDEEENFYNKFLTLDWDGLDSAFTELVNNKRSNIEHHSLGASRSFTQFIEKVSKDVDRDFFRDYLGNLIASEVGLELLVKVGDPVYGIKDLTIKRQEIAFMRVFQLRWSRSPAGRVTEKGGSLANGAMKSNDKWFSVHWRPEIIQALRNVSNPSLPKVRIVNGIPKTRFIEGPTMHAWVQIHQDLSDDEIIKKVLNWTLKITYAIMVLHNQGIEHGDVSGDNILIDQKSGEPILKDFSDELMSDIKLLPKLIPTCILARIISKSRTSLDGVEINKRMAVYDPVLLELCRKEYSSIPEFMAGLIHYMIRKYGIKSVEDVFKKLGFNSAIVEGERGSRQGKDWAMSVGSGFKNSPYGLLTKKQYEEKVTSALLRGLTYEESLVWHEVKIKTNLKFPSRFWSSPTTARNMIYVTFDTIPGFKTARELNDIKTMANLVRKYVINYDSKDKVRFTRNGPMSFLLEVGGLGGLLGNYNNYLTSKNSPGALIRWAFPGLIDLTNPDALDPVEIEQDYWTQPENVRFHILLALNTVPGFKEARDTNDIKLMATLYRQHVLKYKAKDSKYPDGQFGFFQEVGELTTVLSTRRSFIDKTSPSGLLRFALPGLVDASNPNALHPLEIEQDYWTDPQNTLRHIFLALDTIPGFKQARDASDIKTMAELFRKFVIDYKTKDPAKYYNGPMGFFGELGQLGGMMANKYPYIDKIHSPAALIRFAIPKLIDDDNLDALKKYEVEKGALDDPAYAKKIILRALDAIPDFKSEREQENIKKMAEIYRAFVINYKAVDREKYPWDGQETFWEEKAELGVLFNSPRAYLNKNSPAEVLRFVLPNLVDDHNADALHSNEVEYGYWNDPENGRNAIFKALDAIEGFKTARLSNDITTMANLYRSHVINYVAKDKEMFPWNGQQPYFVEVGGLEGLMNFQRPYLLKRNSPAALIRFAIPNLIDPKNPNALHPLEVDAEYWNSPEIARQDILSALYTIPGFREAHQGRDIKRMADLYRNYVIHYVARDKSKYIWNGQNSFFEEVGGLIGLMGAPRAYLAKKNSSASLVEFVLPEIVDQSNPDALKLEEIVGGHNLNIAAEEYFKKPSSEPDDAMLIKQNKETTAMDGAMKAEIQINVDEEFALMLVSAISVGEIPNAFNWEIIRTSESILSKQWFDKPGNFDEGIYLRAWRLLKHAHLLEPVIKDRVFDGQWRIKEKFLELSKEDRLSYLSDEYGQIIKKFIESNRLEPVSIEEDFAFALYKAREVGVLTALAWPEIFSKQEALEPFWQDVPGSINQKLYDHTIELLRQANMVDLVQVSDNQARSQLKQARQRYLEAEKRRMQENVDESVSQQIEDSIRSRVDIEGGGVKSTIQAPRGFWKDENNVRQAIWWALDKIPGFKEARQSGNIRRMADLYRTHVIEYQAKNKSFGNGQNGYFMEIGGLRGVMGNPYGFLDAKFSSGALLRFALPGLIDEDAVGALRPWEVEEVWEDQRLAKKAIIQTLDKIPGFQNARQVGNVKVMAYLYRKYVMTYLAKNASNQSEQTGYFREFGGLGGLMGRHRMFLENKKNSVAAILRFALPALVDEDAPDSLRPWEVEYVWDDQRLAKKAIIQALDRIPIFRQVRQAENIKAMAYLYRKYVITYKGKNVRNGTEQMGYFTEVGGIGGLLGQPKIFLGSRSNSPAALLRFALPGLVDEDAIGALRPWEVERVWNDQRLAKKAIIQALDKIPGFQHAREAGNIPEMADLYRRYVIKYRAKKEGYYNGQTGYFTEVGGLDGLMSWQRVFLKNIQNSPVALLRFALPGLIDEDAAGALRPWEVEDSWSDQRLAKKAVIQVLDKIPDFKRAREAKDIKRMADLYRQNVIKEGQSKYFYKFGLEGLMRTRHLDKGGSGAALLRFALPELVDLNNPNALRSDEIERDKAQLVEIQKQSVFNLRRQPKNVLSKNGGIDMNPAQMRMQVKNQGEDFKFDFNGIEIDTAQVTGATFTIRTMTPVIDLPLILGLEKEPEALAKV